MFKKYKELSDVVSLLVYCPSETAYLLNKEPNGEFWLPTSKCEKNCWKMTAHKINFELFGVDAGSHCVPIRICRVWLPDHPLGSVYHAVYKTAIKSDIKKKAKIKAGIRSKLQWFSTLEMDRQRAHLTLRSPELAIFTFLAAGDQPKDIENMEEFDSGLFIEISEDNVLLSAEGGGGAVAMSSPNYQLLHAAGYTKEDQIRIYKEYVLAVFPAMYMSPQVFLQFAVDVGWERSQCASLFRAADLTGRRGLSFLELLLWCAAMEPVTQHNGIIAETRCRYIFRYFDANRDLKLEYQEFKELMAALRAARQLPVDALSVSRDTDLCLKQLALEANGQLPLADFLRAVSELRVRGTSSLLRCPRSICGYIADLYEREKEVDTGSVSDKSAQINQLVCVSPHHMTPVGPRRGPPYEAPSTDYKLAAYVVQICPKSPNEMLEIRYFDEGAITSSTARLIVEPAPSLDVLAASSTPVAALAAVRYFAAPLQKPAVAGIKRNSTGGGTTLLKSKWSWMTSEEEMGMAAMLIKMADGVRSICTNEPRLLRLRSPVYAIGDLHGNLEALLAIETGLWPTGPALVPAKLLFLGDFVDRGLYGTELMAYLFAAKLQRPEAVYLIRGNHESREIQKMFSFFTECTRKYGENEGIRVWNAINHVFDVLPLAAVVDDKVFCCHGGIPPPWVCPLITAIDKIPVPLPRPSEQSSLAWELLWNDPVKPNKITASLALELAANEGFASNAKRGTGHVFEQAALDRFLLANQLSHVVRAHELQHAGFLCQLQGRLVSVFSSSHYCGGNNDSGVVLLEGGKLRMITITSDKLS